MTSSRLVTLFPRFQKSIMNDCAKHKLFLTAPPLAPGPFLEESLCGPHALGPQIT